ncbi:uncharacterized protein LOC126567747 [Anopheles maculipalpis]|uniref:uncharacterized protein LOC126567747 n=1 Tax=Anopheles maculipalpis TaxID=1496333 RepID=UPI002158D483|nr:uncharacterized protein LOC126567747 [Anopheles maculipalpis]
MDPFGEMQCNIGGQNFQPTPSVDGSVDGSSMTPSPSSIIKPIVPDTPSSPNDPEHQQEKSDCTPENSKKSDSSPEGGADAFGGLPGGAGRVGAAPGTAHDSVAKSLSMQEMFKPGRSVSEEPTTKTKPSEADSNDTALVDSVRNAFAFTIDFGDGKKPVDSQRHEKMLERFQARHKRGVSLSKLESSSSTSSPSGSAREQQGGGSSRAPASVNLPRRNKQLVYEPADHQQASQQMVMIDDSTGRPVAVKLREKNQRSVGRDQSATKRHSWSPRTSMSEMGTASGRTQEAAPKQVVTRSTANSGRFAPKSATLALALEQQQQQQQVGNLERKDYSYSSSEFNAESLDSSGGIPCLEAPLENFRKTKGDDGEDDDEVSEAGTYTIDGANYTEEQKERMNIDRIGPSHVALPPEVIDPVPLVPAAAVRPTDFREELEVIDLERTGTTAGAGDRRNGRTAMHEETSPAPQATENRKHNILEVSYFHEPSPAASGGKGVAGGGTAQERTKSKQSYIEKLKSRMKNITQKSSGGSTGSSRPSSGKQQQQQQCGMIAPELDSPDQGTFTSVTTSGILSVKPTLLEGNSVVPVGQRRRNSLTKSHIDSSEYVQGVAKLNIHATSCTADGVDEMLLKVEAPEEELKILNCYTDSEKAHQGGGGHHRQVKKGDVSPVRRKTPSDVAALTSVATKKDWIQEWAKNAREYSKSTSPKVHPHEPPPATTAYSNASNVAGSMTRSYGAESDADAANRRSSRSNQFGYDFDIDITKSDYYEAKKYEEFGDNLDHRQHYRALIGARNNHQPGSGSDPLMFRNPHQQLTTTSPDEEHQFREPLPYAMNEFARTGSRGSMRRYGHNQHPSPVTPSAAAAKPPMSPSKIPSPIGSIGRARSVSRNRSLQGSNSDLSGNETEMYLQKTAAAISTLQNLQRRNSLRNSSSHHSSSPLSPASRKISPKVSPMNSLHSPIHSPGPSSNNYGDINSPLYSPQHLQQRNNLQHHQLHQNIGGGVGHKRNHSLDGGADPLSSPTSYLPNGASGGAGGGHMTRSLNTNTTSPKLDFSKRHHMRHNSYEGVMSSLPPKSVKCFLQFDQSVGVGYYGERSEPLDVDADVDDLEDADDCRDYDEEEFEEDIDDDDDEEMDVNIRKTGGLIADSVMPRPRAMSLEPRKRSGVVQQHLPTSTGAKQVMAANQKNVVVNRVQKTQPQQQQQQHLTSPIKRSSSFSVKANVMKPATPTMSTKTGGLTGVNGRTVSGGSRIQKSASSTSFKKMAAGALDNSVQPQQYHHHTVQPPHHRHQLVMDPNYPDELMLYINDGDDDGLQMRDRRQQDDYSSNSLTDEDDPVDDLDDEDLDVNGARLEKEPLTNTRYNKTFLMRMEQNKKLAGGGGGGGAAVGGAGPAGSLKQTGGAAACPNTPELPRRAVQMRGLGRDRASMPRDSSLNRMKQDLNLRKSSTGREMLMGGKGQQQSTQSINSTSSSAVGSGGKVQPKYLDISKYKSSNAANFLKKDESKSYLLRQEGVRKSPSSASVSSAMSRTDPTRMSARSIKSASSAASKSSGSGTVASGVTKKDPVTVAKKQELEMWRRRASYDPMKAALEGKKKQQEESRRLAAAQQQQQTQLHSERQSKSNESSVLRSQSYHSGVGNVGGGRLYQGNVGNSSNVNLRGTYNQTLGEHPESGSGDNRWTLTSTESSEDLDGDDDYVN